MFPMLFTFTLSVNENASIKMSALSLCFSRRSVLTSCLIASGGEQSFTGKYIISIPESYLTISEVYI